MAEKNEGFYDPKSDRRALRELYEVYWRSWFALRNSLDGFRGWLVSCSVGSDEVLEKKDSDKLQKMIDKIEKRLDKLEVEINIFDEVFVSAISTREGEYRGHYEGDIDV